MSASRPLRTHQAQTAAIAGGQAPEITDILAAVTRGGGKSLLPVIAAHALLAARLVERVCWVVPRDSLRQQAEEAFADPAWRRTLGHAVSVRAADNAPDPARGLQGYVTTYQSVAASPDLHLAEFRRHRTLLVLDEVHHLPALSDMAPDPLADPAAPDLAAGWSRALLPLLETARLRLLLSGTLQRADGRSISCTPAEKRDHLRRHRPRGVSVSKGCELMGLTRSTFYNASPAAPPDDDIVARIGTICDEFECYGYRRVGAALRHQGVVVNGKKLRRLMREHDLQPKQRSRLRTAAPTSEQSQVGQKPDLAPLLGKAAHCQYRPWLRESWSERLPAPGRR